MEMEMEMEMGVRWVGVGDECEMSDVVGDGDGNGCVRWGWYLLKRCLSDYRTLIGVKGPLVILDNVKVCGFGDGDGDGNGLSVCL